MKSNRVEHIYKIFIIFEANFEFFVPARIMGWFSINLKLTSATRPAFLLNGAAERSRSNPAFLVYAAKIPLVSNPVALHTGQSSTSSKLLSGHPTT